MPQQPTTPRPARSWSAHPDLDGPVPPAESYQPPPRTRPATDWPKFGNLGASTTLVADEQPVTVPARLYIGYQEQGRTGHGVSRFLREAAPPAPRRRWFARAIGWFRR